MPIPPRTVRCRRLSSSLILGLTWAWLAAFPAYAAPPAQRELEIVTVEKPAHADDIEEASYLALANAPAFLPRSYLYWGSPAGPRDDRQPLVFVLEYALHLPFYNDLRAKALLGESWAGAATLSFEGALRMLNEPSSPVRMPSYRPTLSGQLFYIWHRPQPVLFSFRTGFFHYSNGQDRCTFDATLRDGVEACRDRIAQVTDPSGELNRTTGNFSTNGYLFALNGRIHRLNAKGLAIAHLALGIAAFGNMRVGAGQMESELRELYGWGELQVDMEAQRLYDWGSLTLRSSLSGYPKTGREVPKTSGTLEAVVGTRWVAGFGLFVRYYGGRDFYNAFFVDSIQQFAIGLAWNAERPLTFKPPP